MSRSTPKKSMIQFIDFELMLLRDYVKYVEEYFTSQGKDLDIKFKEFQSIAEDDPSREQMDNYHQSYYEAMLDNLIDDNFYIEEFTQRFRYSLIIQTYSFAEKYLSKIGDHFRAKNKTKNLKGNYIQKLQQSITQVNIESCTDYDFMVNFTELRNCVVHNEGVIYSNSKYADRLIAIQNLEKNKLIDLKETVGVKRIRYNIIIDEKLFIDESINKIENFLHEVDEILEKHY